MADTPQHPSDEELVVRMVAGDESGLSGLYDRHAGSAFGIAYAITGNRDDAEEAVSDGFVQCWTQADRFDPERGSVAAWLHTVVRSRAHDRARRTGRHTRLAAKAGRILEAAGAGSGSEATVPAALAGGGSSDPEHDAARGQTAAAVRAALAELPEDQRRAIELAWLADLSHAEVAEVLGAPLGTVKTRIRSGMGKLRDVLRAYGSQGEP